MISCVNVLCVATVLQVQHAVMPVSVAPDEGTANLDCAVNQGQMYSDVPLQSMASGGNQYQPGVDLYNQQTDNMSQQMWDPTSAMPSQQMWDPTSAMPRQTMRQPNPHSSMTAPRMASPGMTSMV